MSIRVKKFDFDNVKRHRMWLLIGRRGTGKSVLLRDILYNTRDMYDIVIACSPTFESQEMLKKCMPSCFVYPYYCPTKIDELIKISSSLLSEGTTRHFLIVLDDCVYDKSIFKTSTQRYIAMNGRHIYCTQIILTQYVLDLPPDVRSQIDYVISLKESILANKKKLYTFFFGVFKTLDDFITTMDKCTQNYEAIILDNTCVSTVPDECVFWYKASLNIPDFKLGKSIFYKLTDENKRTSVSIEKPDDKNHIQVFKDDV